MSTEPDFLTPAEFRELKAPIMRRLELRRRDLQAKGLTSCLFCVHILFNIAGAPPRRAPAAGCAPHDQRALLADSSSVSSLLRHNSLLLQPRLRCLACPACTPSSLLGTKQSVQL